MVCLAVSYTIKPGREDTALEYINKLIEYTRSEPGNLLYIWHRSPADPARFFLYEQYRDQAALEAHRTAPVVQQCVFNGLAKICDSRQIEQYETLE
jgi:(4S)-4-hydroxy-5-phosphonooxypentane-2,3-dione isomerase